MAERLKRRVLRCLYQGSGLPAASSYSYWRMPSLRAWAAAGVLAHGGGDDEVLAQGGGELGARAGEPPCPTPLGTAPPVLGTCCTPLSAVGRGSCWRAPG